jgi:internalin A
MSTKIRVISTSAGLLASAFALLLTGRLLAGEDDAMAEKAIQAFGGEVIRSPDTPGKPIISVDFNATQVTDAGLKELAGLKSLQTLHLRFTKVTDVGLKELAGLKTLQFVTLTYTQVTDAGLKELANLKNLSRLNLMNTQVTDAGVRELQKALPKCVIDQ